MRRAHLFGTYGCKSAENTLHEAHDCLVTAAMEMLAAARSVQSVR